MNLRKVGRWAMWSAGGLAAILAGLYLLRWPLFGGRVRREIESLAREHLQADVSIGRLSGTLFTSIRAEEIELRPRAGSPLGAGRVLRADVRYGLLGSGTLDLEARGVEISLARGLRPEPVHQTIREAFGLVPSIRFAGRAQLREARIELADGRRIAVEEATLDGANWTVRFRTTGFGEVQARARAPEAGALVIESTATEGPVRWAKVALGPPERSTLTLDSEVAGNVIHWEGRLTRDRAGLVERADGELKVPQGHAKTQIDLVSGRGRLDIDGTVSLREPVRADVALQGLAEGPLEGPLEAWTFSNVLAKARDVLYDSLKIDFFEASASNGTLAGIPVKAGFTAGQDHAVVEGVARWEGRVELDLTCTAEVADLGPYLALLQEPPPLVAHQAKAKGKLSIAARGISFDGTVLCGPGSLGGRTWQSLRLVGTITPGALEAREMVVRGTPVADVVTGKGRLEGNRINAQFGAGPDEAGVKGRLERSGDLDLEFFVKGPCLWAKRTVGVEIPGWASPLELSGRIVHAAETTRAMLDLSLGKVLTAKPVVVARQRGGEWALEFRAGTVDLPEGRRVHHDPFKMTVAAGHLSCPDLKVALSDPNVTARMTSSVDWTPEKTTVAIETRELEAWGMALESFKGTVVVDRPRGAIDVQAEGGWKKGPSFKAAGSLGGESTLRLVASVPDLRDPFARKLLGGFPLEGSVSADLQISGSIGRPQASGTVSLRGLAVGEVKPVQLDLHVHTDQSRVVCFDGAEATPYGTLAAEGRIGLPWAESRPRLDAKATLETENLSAFLEHVGPVVRKWVPGGSFHIEAGVHGPVATPVWAIDVSFNSERFKPPEPLGVATDLRCEARLDQTGLRVETLKGRLGGGAFQGSGLWEIWKERRPLRLRVSGRDLLVVDDEMARIRIDPDATLRYDDERGLWLQGSVEVPLILYHREFGSPKIGSGARREALRTLEAMVPRFRFTPLAVGGFRIPGLEGLEQLHLDLRFKTTGEFRIENSVIGLFITAEGQLRGTATEPAVSGWVRTPPHHGEIRLGPGAFIRVDSAEALIPAEAGKDISVRFEGHVGSGQDQIHILVIGPPDRASLTLSSDSGKSETQKELLSILGQKVALGELTGELTPGLADDWPIADRKPTFLERILPTVVPGEAPGQRREPWELPAVGTARGTVVRTEYILNRWFSIVAETDRQADATGDLKLRIRF